jgi:hypothetical protein
MGTMKMVWFFALTFLLTKTELMLTTLKVTNQDGVMKHVPDRRLKLDWQDGKLNVNIEDEQYRNIANFGKVKIHRPCRCSLKYWITSRLM